VKQKFIDYFATKEVYYINEYNATKGCGQQFLEKAGVEVCQLKQQ
jgi:hypothetical protein